MKAQRKPPNRKTSGGFVDLFIAHLLGDTELNGTRAAIAAGYSEKTASSQASRLLKHVKVRAALEKFREKQRRRIEVTSDLVIQELAGIATVDIGRAFDEAGNLLALKDIPEDLRRTISELTVLEEFSGKGEEREHVGFTKKIKFCNKIGALNMLGKHLKLWVDLNVNMDRPTLEEIVAESKKGESD